VNAAVPILTPLALENAPLLRRLQAQDFASKTQLAAHLGRDLPNLNKTLKRLAAEGLIDGVQLTAAGANAVRAIAGLEGASPPPMAAAPAGYAELIWLQVEPDPLNPRKHFDDAALEELADSIARDGLLENLVVRSARVGSGGPEGPTTAGQHRLVAGERRWRAIGKLIERGAWPRERPILCKVVDLDDAGHRRVALVENLQRKDLRPIDEAQALKALMEVTGAGTAEVAQEIGFTQRFVQQRLQLLELPDKLQDQVNAGELPIEKARTAIAILPKLPPIKQVELREGKITVDEAKDWLDRRPPALELSPQAWLMAVEIFDAMDRKPMKKSSWEADRTEVGYAAQDDKRLEELRRAHLLDGPNKQRDNQSVETGRLYVAFTWGGAGKIYAQFGDDARGQDRAQALLARLRKEAGVEDELSPGSYHTTWLNRPIVVPPEIADGYAKILEKRKQERAAADARMAREKAAAETCKAEAVANAEVAQAILEDLGGQEPGAAHPRFAATLAAAGAQTPWRMDEHGGVYSADGQEIMWRAWDNGDRPWIRVQRALLVAAVNLAAGAAFRVQPDADEAEAETADAEAA
jgi:ParB/RepB/Spo0J family partition protein